MINISNKFNYIEINDLTDLKNSKISMYPKKTTTFDIVVFSDFGNIENILIDENERTTRESVYNVELEGLSDGELDTTTTESVSNGEYEMVDNRNIYIKRNGGSIMLTSKMFDRNLVKIEGLETSIDDVISFLSQNTSI